MDTKDKEGQNTRSLAYSSMIEKIDIKKQRTTEKTGCMGKKYL